MGKSLQLLTMTDMTAWTRYHLDTRDHWNSVILVLPLFAIYQVGLLSTGGIRNGVDIVTDGLLSVTGGSPALYVVLIVCMTIVALLAALELSRLGQRPFRRELFLAVLAESLLYATVMGTCILALLSAVPGFDPSLSSAVAETSPMSRFVLSMGAGVHEELVFRLGIFGGIVAVGNRLGASRGRVLFGALLVSSLLFSAVHYVGPLADPFTAYSFVYRTLAGVIFAGLYVVRSFAVAVYTHAIYDVLVLVF